MKIQIEALESRELLLWLMDRIDPDGMFITLERGKKLYMRPIDLYYVFALPHGGRDMKVYNPKRQAIEMDHMKETLGVKKNIEISHCQKVIEVVGVDELTLSCFFMILSARLLLCRPKHHIGKDDVWDDYLDEIKYFIAKKKARNVMDVANSEAIKQEQ